MLQVIKDYKYYGSWWWEVIRSNNKDRSSVTTTDLLVVVTIVIMLVATLWWLYKLSLSYYSGPALPPGPRTLPIVGYLPFLRPDLHKQLTRMGETYGPIFKFRIGSKLQVVINTPELIREVVRHQDDIFANRSVTVAMSIFSRGGQDIGFAKNDSNWRKLRKIFVHDVLSNRNLEASSHFRKDEVRRTIRNVFSKVGTTVNISEISFLTATNVVKRMIWENSTDEGAAYKHLGIELQMVTSKMIELLGQPNVSDFFPSLSWFDLQGVARNMKMQLEKLDSIFTSIIDDRLKSTISKLSEDRTHPTITSRKDFLQILLELKDQKHEKSLNIIQIKSLLLEIIFGATDTTTTLMEWAMAEIFQNPKVKKRILHELEDVVGINNVVEECHLGNLEYLDATIKETLRLHPIAPFLIPREPSQDCIVGGFKIPRGARIFLNVWSVHRDPRYWDNPLDFCPERFLTGTGVDKCDYNGHNTKFLPFGSGRRVCAGLRLAEKMQMFILASLLHSFDWCLPEGEEHDLSEKYGISLSKRKPLIAIPSQRLPDASLYV